MRLTLVPDEVQFLQKRQRDDTGRVFAWDGRIFRAIFPEQTEHVKSMFTSGFLNELISKSLFPETWITEYTMEGYSLVLEHRRIWPVLYPQDWTFSMLKEASLAVCRVAGIAKRYGYNMRDCHGLNVLFDGTIPKFIDLGSFISDNHLGWKPYEEFLRFYYYPLKIWQYNNFVGKLSIFSANLTSHEAYLKYQYPCFRRLSPRLTDRLIDWSLKGERLSSSCIPDMEAAPGLGNLILRKLIDKKIYTPRCINLEKLSKSIEGIGQRKAGSTWANYHPNIKDKADRFERIIEIVNSLEEPVRSAIDFGGNQGKFSRKLIEQTRVKEVVCIDSDENAIDAGYCQGMPAQTGKITFVHYDCMGGIVKLRFMLPNERFKSDMVIALALTHHLIFSQGYDADEIFKVMFSYTRKYVLIEFMPLGLWVAGQKPNTPAWYTVEWFRKTFQNYFDLLWEEQLRENNILFVGKVRQR
jgi:hypothetical protein